MSLALKAMRLGIAMAYQSQLIKEYCPDILFEMLTPHEMRVDLGARLPVFFPFHSESRARLLVTLFLIFSRVYTIGYYYQIDCVIELRSGE
ncbi:hypothetical protein AC480_02415 [miscellaneous Crenarchaeota group archaeon SMTZ1-55]|nr:MAG: hypothetical protein AC480_02415 [miscellaneous Crenarchaeota group archaeon SMTZ1-55]